MSNCNCNCLPQCSTPTDILNCPDSSDHLEALSAYDDNCSPRKLSGLGMLYRDSSGVYHTDGSVNKGEIKLNPESVSGVNDLLGRGADGTILKIGGDSLDGATLVRVGGQWVATLRTGDKTIFQLTELGEYSDNLAVFGCGPGGTLRLGKFEGCESSVLWFDSTGKIKCKTIADLSKDLVLSPLCAAIVDAPTSFSASKFLTCDEDGKIVKAPYASPTNIDFLTAPVLLYSQHKGNPVDAPSNIIHYPAAPLATTGAFLTETTTVNLVDKPKYSPGAVAVQLNIIIKAYADTGSAFDIVVTVNGMEYSRAALPGEFRGGCNHNQVVVPINNPAKDIQIGCYFQVFSGDNIIDGGLVMVYLQAFVY